MAAEGGGYPLLSGVETLLVREPGRGRYDLEQRSFVCVDEVRWLVKQIPNTIANQEDIRQLVRASASTGANYIEANEGLSKKDVLYRIKVCRKESKESRFFLRLLDTGDNASSETKRQELVQEATELMNIFGPIIRKLEK